MKQQARIPRIAVVAIAMTFLSTFAVRVALSEKRHSTQTQQRHEKEPRQQSTFTCGSSLMVDGYGGTQSILQCERDTQYCYEQWAGVAPVGIRKCAVLRDKATTCADLVPKENAPGLMCEGSRSTGIHVTLVLP